MQSFLGEKTRELELRRAKSPSGLSQIDVNHMETYNHARNLLKSDINDFLVKENPELAKQYDDATLHYANEVVPRKNLHYILHKLGHDPSPKQVTNAIKNSFHFEKFIPDYAKDEANKIEKAVQAKEATQAALGSILGFTLSHNMPISGELMGAGAGAVLANPIAKIGSMLPKKSISNFISKAYPYARAPILANILAAYGKTNTKGNNNGNN